MNRIITYAVNLDDGLVTSRVGHQVAVPVLDFEAIGADGDYTKPLTYTLEKFSVHDWQPWGDYRWTKKIPVELKNLHRAYWGFPPLPEPRTLAAAAPANPGVHYSR